MNQFPFVKCFHPRRVYNQYAHKELLVGCGECPACLESRTSFNVLRCDNESRQHELTWFITLTMRDEHLPYATAWSTNDDHYHFYYSSYRWRGEELGDLEYTCDYSDVDFADYLNRVHYKDQPQGLPAIGVLCKRDVQLFVMRLRKEIFVKTLHYEFKKKYPRSPRFVRRVLKSGKTSSRRFESEEYKLFRKNEGRRIWQASALKFFAVGEYGSAYLRPHYHLLVWCDHPFARHIMSSCVSKSWRFGRKDCQLVSGSASQYVAGYVNSFSHIPSFLRFKDFRPFMLHSKSLGVPPFEPCREVVEDASSGESVVYYRPTPQGVQRCEFWRSAVCRLYPRVFGFSENGDVTNRRLYTLWSSVSKFWTSPMKAAYDISRILVLGDRYSYDFSVHYTYTDSYQLCSQICEDLFRCRFAYPRGSVSSLDFFAESDLIRRCQSRIYTCLLISRSFLEFCDIVKCDAYVYYAAIRDFWQNHDYRCLSNWHSVVADFLSDKDNQMDFIVDFVDEDTGEIFRQLDFESVCCLDPNSVYYRYFVSYMTNRHNDRLKHKKFNDLNNVLDG